MLQPLPLQLVKAFLGGDGESKQPGLNAPILAGNIQYQKLSSREYFSNLTKSQRLLL